MQDKNFEIKNFDAARRMSSIKKEIAVDFLAEHLHDSKSNEKIVIKEAVDYAQKDIPSFGGFILMGYYETKLVGALVVIKTGMEHYLPGYYLAYLAIHRDFRNQGLEEKLLKRAVRLTRGKMAVQLALGDPSQELFKQFGFVKKFTQMRLVQ